MLFFFVAICTWTRECSSAKGECCTEFMLHMFLAVEKCPSFDITQTN
jgi:hypothetical protein